MIEVFCDGGSRGNPGPSAYGFAVKKGERFIKKGQGYIGIATNNIAEYTALVEALGWLSENLPEADIKVFLDSKLVVSQLNGLYKIKNVRIRELVIKIRKLETRLGNISYHYISRIYNKEADKLVNIALNKEIYGT